MRRSEGAGGDSDHTVETRHKLAPAWRSWVTIATGRGGRRDGGQAFTRRMNRARTIGYLASCGASMLATNVALAPVGWAGSPGPPRVASADTGVCRTFTGHSTVCVSRP